jgi:hypothetical protein
MNNAEAMMSAFSKDCDLAVVRAIQLKFSCLQAMHVRSFKTLEIMVFSLNAMDIYVHLHLQFLRRKTEHT